MSNITITNMKIIGDGEDNHEIRSRICSISINQSSILIIPRVNDLGTSLFYLHTNTSFNCLKYDKRGYFARC